jgi:hypothetical protein
MIEITQDELSDLPVNPANFAEATGTTTSQQDEPEDEGFDADHPYGQSNEVIPADDQALKCHEACLKAGPLFQNLNDVINEYKPFILALKNKFKVKKGYRGLQIKFPDFPEPVYYAEYCDKVFSLTTTRINQLLNHSDEPYIKATPKPLEERNDYIKGLQAGRQQAETQMKAKGVDTKSTLADIVNPQTDVLEKAQAAIVNPQTDVLEKAQAAIDKHQKMLAAKQDVIDSMQAVIDAQAAEIIELREALAEAQAVTA